MEPYSSSVIELDIVAAPSPNTVIKGSIASPSTIAHIVAQKYVMHTPLYRQEQELKKQNIQLSRQTMANWCRRLVKGNILANAR